MQNHKNADALPAFRSVVGLRGRRGRILASGQAKVDGVGEPLGWQRWWTLVDPSAVEAAPTSTMAVRRVDLPVNAALGQLPATALSSQSDCRQSTVLPLTTTVGVPKPLLPSPLSCHSDLSFSAVVRFFWICAS
jgi:hypothetical protein